MKRVILDENLPVQLRLALVKEREIAIIEVPFLKRNDIPRMKERIAKAILIAGKGDYMVVEWA